MAKLALADAVADAVEKHGDGTSDEETSNEETTVIDKTGTTDSTTNSETDGKTDDKSTATETVVSEDTQFALDLYNSLRDPQKAYGTLELLARQFGLEVRKGEVTKAEATQTIQEILNEGLGADYQFLAQKFGPILEKLFNQELNKRTAPVTNKLLEMEARAVNGEISHELAELSTRTKGASSKFEDELVKWMSKYQPAQNSNVTVREFLDDAWSAVSQNDAVKSQLKRTVDRINKNATDANVASTGADTEVVKMAPNKKISVADAVRLAMQGKRLQR